MSDRVPDVVGHVVAYRAWALDVRWRRVELRSVWHRSEAWPTEDWMRAECKYCIDIPGEDCACGIYCALDRQGLYDLGYMRDWGVREALYCYGEVALAGKVVPAAKGYRAERARPLRIWLPHRAWELASDLRRTYNVPVDLTNPYERTA